MQIRIFLSATAALLMSVVQASAEVGAAYYVPPGGDELRVAGTVRSISIAKNSASTTGTWINQNFRRTGRCSKDSLSIAVAKFTAFSLPSNKPTVGPAVIQNGSARIKKISATLAEKHPRSVFDAVYNALIAGTAKAVCVIETDNALTVVVTTNQNAVSMTFRNVNSRSINDVEPVRLLVLSL